jgi:hypothetical protein
MDLRQSIAGQSLILGPFNPTGGYCLQICLLFCSFEEMIIDARLSIQTHQSLDNSSPPSLLTGGKSNPQFEVILTINHLYI